MKHAPVETPVPIPTSIACAHCGKPLDCLTSFGLAAPIDSPVPPADFCNLHCLSFWALAAIGKGGRA